MVRTGQAGPPDAIRELAYRSTRHARLPVEAMHRHELLQRYGEAFFATPERLEFYLLLLTVSGRGEHEVDFGTVELRRGTVQLIRPGQVHRFRWQGTAVADLVVFPPESLRPSTGDHLLPLGTGALHGQLSSQETARLRRDIQAIRLEQEQFDGTARFGALLRARLDVLLLEVGVRLGHQPAAARSSRYVAFCALLEARFATTRHAQDYAKALGYSRRTLNRACEQATGRSAKDLVDERVALEAKRLLIGSDSPVEQIAVRLGFSEATNFGKFFHRMSATTPGDFRRSHR